MVSEVSDKERFIHMNAAENLIVLVNYPYEQFRFIVNNYGGSVSDAIRQMQSGIEAVKGDGKVTFGMLSTKSWLCCNLDNLGGFKISMSINVPEGPEAAEWWKEVRTLQVEKWQKDQLSFKREDVNGCRLTISSRFMLGRKASEHIARVTACAKECIGIYKTKFMPAEKLAAM